MTDPPKGPPLEILSKAGVVMRLLEEHGELSASAIAALADEPVSSTYRMLTSLGAVGWVDPSPTRGLYRLGIFAMRIGGAIEDGLNIREASTPALRSLLAGTGATSYLCIRNGTRAVCVERFEGTDVRSLALTLGGSLPLYLGAAPIAILAHLPDHDLEKVMTAFDMQREDDPSVPDQGVLLATIASTREQGYAVSDGDVTPGIAALGAPVFDHHGVVQGAISISGLRGQILSTTTPTDHLIIDAACSASRALGFSGGQR